jgi:hypothetical protein
MKTITTTIRILGKLKYKRLKNTTSPACINVTQSESTTIPTAGTDSPDTKKAADGGRVYSDIYFENKEIPNNLEKVAQLCEKNKDLYSNNMNYDVNDVKAIYTLGQNDYTPTQSSEGVDSSASDVKLEAIEGESLVALGSIVISRNRAGRIRRIDLIYEFI